MRVHVYKELTHVANSNTFHYINHILFSFMTLTFIKQMESSIGLHTINYQDDPQYIEGS